MQRLQQFFTLFWVYSFATTLDSQLQVGVSHGGLYECTPNVVSEGKRTDYGTISSPISAVFSRINFCFYSVKEPIEYRLDLKIPESSIGFIKTFDGASTSVTFHNKTVVCGLLCNPEYASLHTVEFQCMKSGFVNAQAILFYPQSGEYHLIYMDIECDDLHWGKRTGDLAHALESLPLFFYLSFQFIRFLIKGKLKMNNSSRIPRWLSSNTDNIVLFILGVAIIISQYVVDGIIPSDEFNYMHILFGFFISSVSILGIYLRIGFSDKSVNFAVPITLCYIGIMFLFHKQFSHFGYITHRAFGISCIATAALFSLLQRYPKFTILAFMCGQLTACLFFSASPFLVDNAQAMHMHAMNYIFLVANFVVGWDMFLISISFAINFIVSKTFLRQYFEFYNHIPQEIEMKAY